ARRAAPKAAAEMDVLIEKLNTLCYSQFNKLDETNKRNLEGDAGINRYANPDVGQAYHISTGGAPKAGQEDSTWNFHWAGVILKSDQDNIVLENYAVGD